MNLDDAIEFIENEYPYASRDARIQHVIDMTDQRWETVEQAMDELEMAKTRVVFNDSHYLYTLHHN